MGWGGGGKGKGGGNSWGGGNKNSGGGGAKDWGRVKRSQEQAMFKDAKNEREASYFWEKQAHLGKSPPYAKSSWKLQEEEREIFGSHDGNVGINFDKYDDIAVQVSGDGSEEFEPIQTFQELWKWFELPQFLLQNVNRCKYTKPTPVQRYAMPIALSGRDVMCCAQTGSGKTCAFLLPIISQIPEEHGTGKVGIVVGAPACPKAVVMAPTRELCSQIHLEARKLCFKSTLRPSEVYGGVDAKPQLWELARGSDIITATPGRLNDFINRGVVSMSSVGFLVLDEADRMLDMGFEPQIREIVQKHDMPSSQDGRSTLMFSATFPSDIQKLAQAFMRTYVWVGVGRVGGAVDTVEQSFKVVWNNHQKESELQKLLRENPTDSTLVFTAMKRTAAALEATLNRSGIEACAIHGDLEQPAREISLARFRSGKAKVLVATDVAARGLDIPKVSHVINFDLPENIEDYVHRIGRTGRIGRNGWSTSFYLAQGNWANTKILGGLIGLLEDAGKAVPEELMQEARKNNVRSWSKGGGKKNNFGGSDARNGTVHSSTVKGSGGGGGSKWGSGGGGSNGGGKGKWGSGGGGSNGGSKGKWGNGGGGNGWGGNDTENGPANGGGGGGWNGSNGKAAGGDNSWPAQNPARNGKGGEGKGGKAPIKGEKRPHEADGGKAAGKSGIKGIPNSKRPRAA